ncbi:MAG: hypothetical protein KIT09_26815 [Bryobacteraceae bacterium]|nr:hypothetical protein [Bryobacteraceae bacterium]
MWGLLIASFFLPQAQTATVVRLYPVNDAARDPAFRSYVKKLQAAVERRDAKSLRKLVDQDVVVGPADDDKGWTKFVAKWRPDDRTNSPVWEALSDLLSLGFIREHPRLFLSPYAAWRFPRDLNPATHLVVTRDEVPLREAPSVRAPTVAALSFDIVLQLGRPERGDGLETWVRIRTLDGTAGYLNTRDAVSPLMPRAQFGMPRGRWVLVALETGDQ